MIPKRMSPEQIENIKELITDGWFVYNPNGSDIHEEIQGLLDHIAALMTELADMTWEYQNVCKFTSDFQDKLAALKVREVALEGEIENLKREAELRKQINAADNQELKEAKARAARLISAAQETLKCWDDEDMNIGPTLENLRRIFGEGK